MTLRDLLMGSEPSHEAVLTSTEFRVLLQQDDRSKECQCHEDSVNPFRLLLGTFSILSVPQISCRGTDN